jgi:hypothetical protein
VVPIRISFDRELMLTRMLLNQGFLHLFCRKVSFLTDPHCRCRVVSQGMKQTYLYLWHPLFQAQWDICDQQNVFFNRQSAYLWVQIVPLFSPTCSFIRMRQTSYRGFKKKEQKLARSFNNTFRYID